MPTRAKSIEDRIYTRERGGVARHYADFRDFKADGGGQEALVAPGETRATDDLALARTLTLARLTRLEAAQEARERLGLQLGASLARVAADHLTAMAIAGSCTVSWLAYSEICLQRAIDYFTDVQPKENPSAWRARRIQAGPRPLDTISPPDLKSFMTWLGSPAVVQYELAREAAAVQAAVARGEKRNRGNTPQPFGQQSIRHHLSALSGVFETAISDGLLEMGKNPVSALRHKPAVPKSTTEPLKVDEVALLIESARTYRPDMGRGGRRPFLYVYELLATHALTGAREDEILSRMDVRDLNFDTRTIIVHSAAKDGGRGEDRIVPMHPQLYEILYPYVRRLGRISGLLFTSPITGGPITDWRKVLDAVAARVGFAPGAVRTKRFRVSYATHRCTCDGVDANQVRLELGHGDLKMMASVYARAQTHSRRMGAEMAYRITPADRATHARTLRALEAA